jgi:hypothetical protein
MERALGQSRSTAKFTKKLIPKLARVTWNDNALGGRDIPTATCEDDLKDAGFIQEAMRRVLTALVPTFVIPTNWYFRAILLGGEFAIDTNYDFDCINAEYHKTVPPTHSSITPAYLINHVLEARASILVASRYLGELVVDPAAAEIVRLKCAELMRKRDAQVKELDLFQEMHLPEARKIRECLNSGEQSFGDFLKLLDHAAKFKTWLAKQNPDEELLRKYYEEVTAESWTDRLGTKTSRWVITTGLGAAVEAFYPTGAAIAAAQGISLLDATLLDRILKGWRPNQFVEGRLASFVTGDKD